MLDLCSKLAGAFRVIVLAPHAPGAAVQETVEGVEVRRFRYCAERFETLAYDGGIVPSLKRRPWTWLLVPLFLLAETVAAARILRRERIALVHAHWLIPQAFCAWLAALLAGRRPPLLCTVHGADVYALAGRGMGALRGFLARRCQALGAVSDAIGRELVLVGAPEDRVSILPMGVNEPAPAGNARDAGHIAFAGRLVEKKGVPVLLRAFARLRRSRPDAALTIAGAGPELEPCRALARALDLGAAVTFRGAITQDDVLGLFSRATIAVMPSIVAADGDTEGLGLVALEAMMCGCPVVASNLPAVATYLRHEDNGILFPAGDDAALATALARLLENAPLRLRIAAQGRRYASERFGWNATAAAYGRWYREALEPR